MCLLRSCGRVANFKNGVFRNGGIEFDTGMYTYVFTWRRMVLKGGGGVGGVGGDINVLEVSVTYLYHVGTFIFVVHIR